MSTNVFELPAHEGESARELSAAEWAQLERNAAEILMAFGLDLDTEITNVTFRPGDVTARSDEARQVRASLHGAVVHRRTGVADRVARGRNLRFGRIDRADVGGSRPRENHLRERAVSAADNDPGQPRAGRQPVEEQ